MPEKRGAWTGEEASCLIWDCSVPWAPLLCVTRAELIQAGWHFPAHSHLCARSTAGEHWLSWRPCTTCGGACWNKGSQAHHLTPEWVQQHLANERWEIVFHLFVPRFFLCRNCAIVEQKNSLGQKALLSLKCMRSCWGFPAVYALAFFFTLAGDSFNVYCINGSPNCLNYIFYYMNPSSTKPGNGRAEMISLVA